MKKASVFLLLVLALLPGCKKEVADSGSKTLSAESLATSPVAEPTETVVIEPKTVVIEPKTVVENNEIRVVIVDTVATVEQEIPLEQKVIYKSPVNFSSLPANAEKYLPLLMSTISDRWPEFETPSIFAAQTEKESCKTLKHKNCWTPYAEFKTSREYGFGFGQITIAYDKNGKVRFNKFEELVKADAGLRNWQFADRYNASMQFLALIVLNKINYKALASVKTKTETDKIAMMLAAYNGGLGGVVSDISLCKNTPGCDPQRWFGHVETTTKKSKAKVNGYGNSVADINRLYPFDILYTRREKYLKFFDDRMIHKKLSSSPHKF